MTTVGYGDYYPVTNGGRFVGAFLMIVGVALFGVIAAFVANLFLSRAGAADGHAPANEIDDAARARATRTSELATELRARLDRLEASMRPSRSGWERLGGARARPCTPCQRSGIGAVRARRS